MSVSKAKAQEERSVVVALVALGLPVMGFGAAAFFSEIGIAEYVSSLVLTVMVAVCMFGVCVVTILAGSMLEVLRVEEQDERWRRWEVEVAAKWEEERAWQAWREEEERRRVRERVEAWQRRQKGRCRGHERAEEKAKAEQETAVRACPYALLGCKPGDSLDEVRRRYRQLVRQYHPDVLMGKDLPPDFLEMGKRRFREIQSAYEGIVGR